jgi:hypothetical protein
MECDMDWGGTAWVLAVLGQRGIGRPPKRERRLFRIGYHPSLALRVQGLLDSRLQHNQHNYSHLLQAQQVVVCM